MTTSELICRRSRSSLRQHQSIELCASRQLASSLPRLLKGVDASSEKSW